MAAATLVPITRAFLAQFYDKYPFEPLSPDVSSLTEKLDAYIQASNATRKKENESDTFLVDRVIEAPRKLDENLWRNREQIEEILYLLEKTHWPATLSAPDDEGAKTIGPVTTSLTEELTKLCKTVEDYQAKTTDKVQQMVFTYMPQDFRGTLIKMQKDLSERSRQAAVAALLTSGGSIKDKYALLWQQQLDRRKTLAGLGSATGLYQAFVKYLVGVPQVLLDFVKTINDADGPMEEQRCRYGPPLMQLTTLANKIHIFMALWWQNFDKEQSIAAEHTQLVQDAVKAYSTELQRFLLFLGEVFANSPFLISAEEAALAEGKDTTVAFQVQDVLAGKQLEVPIEVEVEGSLVAWEFSLTYGKDVGFSVEFVDKNGHKSSMLPYQRYEAHQGHFYSTGVGAYKLIWDNAYSMMYKKTVRYKVDTIPPVTPRAGTGAPLTFADIQAEEELIAGMEHVVVAKDDSADGAPE